MGASYVGGGPQGGPHGLLGGPHSGSDGGPPGGPFGGEAQRSKISGVFTQAVEAINKTFGPHEGSSSSRKWKLQVVSIYSIDKNKYVYVYLFVYLFLCLFVCLFVCLVVFVL